LFEANPLARRVRFYTAKLEMPTVFASHARSTSTSCAAPTALAVQGARGLKRGQGCRSREGSREDKAGGCRRVVRPSSPLARRAPCPPLADYSGPKLSLQSLRAVVVNLDRRPDRMDGVSARLREQCPWLSYSRFDASDGRRDIIRSEDVALSWHTGPNVVYQRLRSMRKGWDDLDSYKERKLELSAGERGCALSHIRAWRHCLEQAGNTDMPLLVLEDDAAPTSEFTALLARAAAAVPADAHVLYLGYSQAAEWRRAVSPDIAESEYVWTTVGYVVWPAGARVMLSRLPVDQPVDNWMACLNASGDLRSYCVTPKIVRQADAWNINSDVGHSDECYWGPDSNIQHSDEFYWGTVDVGAEFYWGSEAGVSTAR